MQRVTRTETALYMRGAGVQPVIHISDLAESGYMPGIGLIASSRVDLEQLAREAGGEVVVDDEPGGGHVVRLLDPAGYRVEVVHRSPVAPLPVRDPVRANVGANRAEFRRFNTKVRLLPGPSSVLRLGHVVMKVPDPRTSFAWYERLFGMKLSDTVHADGPEHLLMAMAHWGHGHQYTDHHTLAFLQVPVPGFDHSAFEVIDIDDVMLGGAYLTQAGHKHSFGVGRHIAGSMVFDYWRDSSGNKIEHWADGDLVNDAYEGSHQPISAAAIAAWGPEVPAEFFE